VGNKRSPTYDGDYQRPVRPERHTHVDMADPRVASCIRFDHRQAVHLLQHCSSMSHKGSLRLSKAKSISPWASPLRVGFPHSGTHRLNRRQPSHPSKRPTREASEPGHSSPLSTSNTIETHTSLTSERLTMSPWVEPIS
jgi:hypothetical protein